MIELEETVLLHDKNSTNKNKRLLAGEAADVFNFAMTILTTELGTLEKIGIFRQEIKTFDQFEEISGQINSRPVNDIFNEMQEKSTMLNEIKDEDGTDEVVEFATDLLLKSGALINKMGFKIYPILAAKLQRNNFKYNPEIINNLTNAGFTIDQALFTCKKIWERHDDKHEIDDLFLIAQLSQSGVLDKALKIVSPEAIKFLESLDLSEYHMEAEKLFSGTNDTS